MAPRENPRPPAGKRGPGGRRAAAAVLGSVAALGGAGGSAAAAQSLAGAGGGHQPRTAERRQSRRAQELPAGERTLLSAVFSGLSRQAPAIARPVLDAGVAAGTITQAEENGFLARLAETAADGSGLPTAGAGHTAAPAEALPSNPDGLLVFRQALAAIRAELPVVAEPLVAAALADGSISAAQATRLTGRFEAGPRLGFGLVLRGARAVGATRLP
jgi:hypothetical protein